MKHLVNVGLLFFFTTLLASGLMRFFQPFSLAVTRVHICFGFGVAVLVGLHLSSRGKYFRSLIATPRSKAQAKRRPIPQIAGAVALWALALAAALGDYWPVPQLISYGYEAQHAREIFRPGDQVASMPVKSGLRVHRGASADTGLRIEFDWGPAFGRDVGELDLAGEQTQLAIWAENEEGTVLETLYVSQTCAAASTVSWGGHSLHRRDILPVWFARYEALLGQAPAEEVDSVSSATPVRDFSMDGHLKTDALPFALFVEVNAPGDANSAYNADQPPGVGQPSVVYEARIYPSDDRRYYLMELVGHSGAADLPPGEIDYDLTPLTTAKSLVDKILVKVTWPDELSQADDAGE